MTKTEMKRLSVRFEQDKKQLRKVVENRIKGTKQMLDEMLEKNEHQKGNFKGARVSMMFEAGQLQKKMEKFLKEVEEFEKVMTDHQIANPRS